MNPTEALNFYQALSMEYVQHGMNGRKATQMSVLAQIQNAHAALSPLTKTEAGTDADDGTDQA